MNMKKYLLLAAMCCMAITASAQQITVTGGAGKVPGYTDRVYIGQPFTVSVSGLNGTPQKWSAGIGTVNGQNVFFTSSTSVSNVIIDRAINGGNIGLVSVGATNGRGVAAYLTLVDPNPVLNVGFCVEGTLTTSVTGANDASAFTWNISSSPFNYTQGSSRTWNNLISGSTYTFSVTIIGGTYDGLVLSKTVRVLCLQEARAEGTPSNDGGNLRTGLNQPALELYPNPADDGFVQVRIPTNGRGFSLELVTPAGQVVKQINTAGNTYDLDVTELPTGVYYLRATGTDGYFQTQRLVVE